MLTHQTLGMHLKPIKKMLQVSCDLNVSTFDNLKMLLQFYVSTPTQAMLQCVESDYASRLSSLAKTIRANYLCTNTKHDSILSLKQELVDDTKCNQANTRGLCIQGERRKIRESYPMTFYSKSQRFRIFRCVAA